MKRIYFIKPAGMDGPIKIGCSDLPTDRLDVFMTWSPFPLEVIGSVPGSFKDETFLHQCFADHHSHREWFRSSEKLRSAIKTIIAAGSVDVARESLAPIGTIKKKCGPYKRDSKFLSYNAKLRFARNKHGSDSQTERVYYTLPDEVSRIMNRWQGYVGYRLPRDPMLPTAEEFSLLDRFIADPIGNGAERHSYNKPKPVVVSPVTSAAPSADAAAPAPASARQAGAALFSNSMRS